MMTVTSMICSSACAWAMSPHASNFWTATASGSVAWSPRDSTRDWLRRLDPSDVVQEALAEAAGGFDEYLRQPPLPFYPWLRHFAWDRLIELHRFHLNAQRRSVVRERPLELPLPDQSAVALVRRLAVGGTSPSHRLLRNEIQEKVRGALSALSPHDKEVLVLRYLEGLTTAETASVLGLSVGAVKSRHMRAIVRLRALLDDLDGEMLG